MEPNKSRPLTVAVLIMVAFLIMVIRPERSAEAADELQEKTGHEATENPARAPIFREANSGVKPTGTQGTDRATKRLLNELRRFKKSASYTKGLFEVELVEDNIYEWEVKINLKPEFEEVLKVEFDKLRERTKGGDLLVVRISYFKDHPITGPKVWVAAPTTTKPICYGAWKTSNTSEELILTLMSVLGNNKIYQ